MSVVPFAPSNQLAYLSSDELALVEKMLNDLTGFNVANREAEQRYEGRWVTTQFGISIPPSMQSLQTVAGWSGTVVDVLEERLDWLGWTSEGDDFGLSDVYAANTLDVDSGMAHLDSLIFGTAFVSVGTGFDGEPEQLVTPHSPKSMTALWDRRRRRIAAALAVVVDAEANVSDATLYLPDQTVTMTRSTSLGRWAVVDRDVHNLDRVLVALVPNRIRGSREIGRSEITRAVRYYSDAAMRTMLGLEVNREFYNSPQRVVLGADETMFKNADGSTVSPWSAIQGRVWAVPNDEDGKAPSVQQFSPSSPAPYLDQIKGYATLLAAEAGIPAAYLGFQTDNPASADAIRAGEARLVKRAERRQTVFSRSWAEIGRLVLLVRDGEVPPTFDTTISSRWRDAATPTRSAAADETTKYVGSGILPADSSVTYDRMGLSPAEQRQLTADKRKSAGSALVDRLLAARGGDTGPAAP